MARPGKRDPAATKARSFLDHRSFVTLDGHDRLYGGDLAVRRRECFERDAWKCVDCGYRITWATPFHRKGEMDHEINKSKPGGCDCLHNVRTRCGRFLNGCHDKKHGRNPRWTRDLRHRGALAHGN